MCHREPSSLRCSTSPGLPNSPRCFIVAPRNDRGRSFGEYNDGKTLDRCRSAGRFAGLPLAPASQARDAGGEEGLFQHCVSVRDDDSVRNYQPALREPTIKAFRQMFPNARGEPASEFETQAQYRCMDGKVMVCFIGANLPCVRINTARDNPGADAFCKNASDEAPVAAYATGHDSAYSFKCGGGRAVIDQEIWKLDKRGFAEKIWTAQRCVMSRPRRHLLDGSDSSILSEMRRLAGSISRISTSIS